MANTPVAEDSTSWATGRLIAGLGELARQGFQPVAWEMPHYQGSALANKAAASIFNTTYQRVVYYTADKPNFNAAVSKDFAVGQIFPYVIKRDYYGQRVLPESLGNIEYDIRTVDPTSNYNFTAQDIIDQRAVRTDRARRLCLVLLPPVLAGAGTGLARLRGLQEGDRRHHPARVHLGRAEQGEVMA